MYRQILKPSSKNRTISLPRSWYGMDVEVIAFPIMSVMTVENPVKERRKKREEMLRKYSMDLSGFKFNREEANNYE